MVFLILIMPTHCLLTQVDSHFLTTLDAEIKKYQKGRTVYYSDRLGKAFIVSSIKAFSKNIIVSQYKNPEIDSIILTKKEIRIIRKELRSNKSFTWPDKLLANSKSVQSDSLISFVEKLNKNITDSLISLNEIDEWYNYYKNNLLYQSFSFSKPIYLRQHSVFLMFFSWYSPSGGSHELAFYKRENELWRKWIVFDSGWW